MQISNSGSWQGNYVWAMAKSFLIWTLTLTVCFLVVGFPVVVVLMTVGVLGAVVLQSILPTSAIVVVSGSLLGSMGIAILFSSLILTFKGIHPHDVQWLGWLQDDAKTIKNPLYSSCPLTCDIIKQ
ncbi:MAG: hypothetical protein IGQ45_13270 [Cyanobacterium sp. T60_A2020_053]|nr:hypothetical protein [Cyanobacterium sp. T60_A2020_053]